MGSALSCRKPQYQGNVNNHAPLLLEAAACSEYIDNNSGKRYACADLASFEAYMEQEREIFGDQWPEDEVLGDYSDEYARNLTPSLDLQQCNDLYKEYMQQWEKSEAYRTSCAAFQEVLNKRTPTLIDNCICLGLGSLTCNIEEGDKPWHISMAQYVTFETWFTMIEKHQQSKPRIFYQDPVFKEIDRQFLTEHGGTVIETPASNQIITSDTFLFTPGATFRVIFATLHEVFPALYLGVDFNKCSCCRSQGYAVWKMLVDFLATRDQENVAIPSPEPAFDIKRGRYFFQTGKSEQNWEVYNPVYYTPKEITGPTTTGSGIVRGDGDKEQGAAGSAEQSYPTAELTTELEN